MAGAERSELLGLEFERSRAEAIVEHCLTWCDRPRVTHIILTANASHLCLMGRDPSLRDACWAADLDVMRPNQTLADLTARLMTGIDRC